MQIGQFLDQNCEERIEQIRNMVISSPHEICIERAKYFTESYQLTKDLHPYLRFAKAMSRYLSSMTLKIWDNEYIVGNRCSKFIGTPLYPEVRVDTLEQDVDTFENRSAQKMFISSEDREMLKQIIIPYWKKEELTVKELFLSRIDPDVKNVMDSLLFTVEAEMTNGIGHFFPGHDNLLKFGLDNLILKAENQLSSYPEGSDKAIFMEAVIIISKAVQNSVLRFSKFVKKIAEDSESNERKRELL